MHPLLLPLADFFLAKEFILLVSVILVLSIPIVAIVMYYSFRHQREKLWHETARLALEKGQPIPQQNTADDAAPDGSLPSPPPAGVGYERWVREKRANQRGNDLKGGLVLLGLGVALYLANRGMALPGFVMIGLGAALVLSALLIRNNDDFRGPPPQA